MRSLPKGTEIDELGALVMGSFAEERKDFPTEGRAFSNVVRAVQLQGDNCPECQANDDPDAIPLHPGCDCDIVTEEVQRGQPAAAEHFTAAITMEAVEYLGSDEGPQAIRLDPLSASVLPVEGTRFSDITRWLSRAPIDDTDFVSVMVGETEGINSITLSTAKRTEGTGVVRDMYLIPVNEISIDTFKGIYDEIRREAKDAKSSTGTSNDDGSV